MTPLKMYNLMALGLIPMLALSCLTPLDRFTDYAGGQVVISGQITPLQETNVVYVTRTAETERLPKAVSNAVVALYENNVLVKYYEEEEEVEGKYVLKNLAGVPGREYHLQVTLEDGHVYQSKPERMPTAIGNDEIYYLIEKEQYIDGDGVAAERNFLRIYSNHTLAASADPLFIKWNVVEVYLLSPTDFPDPFNSIPPPCFIAQPVDPQKIVLFTNEEVKIGEIPELHIASRLIDPSFKERHYFTVYQSALTREAYEYWRQVNNVANQVGSIFDPPPARVRGNFSGANNEDEEVHGYFQAVNQNFNRFYTLPEDLPYRMPAHCEYDENRNYYDYPSECLDCLSVRNSSYERPAWF